MIIHFENQVQGFIFLNPLEARNFVYYDTQVKYGQKYKYEVDAYQVVIGTNYIFRSVLIHHQIFVYNF